MRDYLALEEIAVFPIQSERFPDGRPELVPAIVCHDGFSLSIQASSQHSSVPQDDDGPWIEFEVGGDGSEPFLTPYTAHTDDGMFIYTSVPIDVLRKIIDKHGGITLDGQTYTYTTQKESPDRILSRYIMSPSLRSFGLMQESLRSINHLDKKCDMIECHHCSYFKSAIEGSENERVGERAFCPLTAITHKSVVVITDERERIEMVSELLDLVKSPAKDLSAENI